MDNLKYLKTEVNIKDYIEEKTGQRTFKAGSNTYRFKTCPLCGGGDHFDVDTSKNYYNTWNNCSSGTIIDFHMDYYKKDIKESIKALSIEFNLSSDLNFNTQKQEKSIENPFEVTPTQLQEAKKSIDLTHHIVDYYNTKNIEISYFNQRLLGEKIFNDKLSNKFDSLIDNIKFFTANPRDVFPNEILPNLSNIAAYEHIIPVWENGKIVNAILRRNDNKSVDFQKVMNLKGLEVQLFNNKYLNENHKRIFITEGIFDCLSLEMLGYKAICLNSVNNLNKLMKSIHKNIEICKKIEFIVAFDNDKKSQPIAAKLIHLLNQSNIKSINLTKSLPYKDINDFYMADLTGLENYISEALRPPSTFDYMEQYFDNIKRNNETEPSKTGFSNIDNLFNGGLYPGLYTIGAISSLGKTALMIQMADNLAKNGNPVLFFSLEMPKDELISRCISRRMFELDYLKCIKISTLRVNTKKIDDCKEEYEKACLDFINESSKNLTIISKGKNNNLDIDINYITEYVENFIEYTGKKPIVIIDYLQIVMPDMELKQTEKQAIDTTVRRLKNISTKHYIPVIVISSFNRENYNNPVNFACFKESGGIEYASDFVLGLQLSELDKLGEIKGGNEKAQKALLIEKLHAAKKAIPRQITLVILKNRNGLSFANQEMEFHPINNMFVEV